MRRLVPFVLFTMAALPILARAATFGVRPNAVTIDADHPIAQISVSSLNARVVSFDVRVHRWMQKGAAEIVEAGEAPGLIVVPPVFTIAPYDTTLLRVTFRQMPALPKSEEAYKVVMTEIVGSSVTRIVTVPLFVRGAPPSGTISYAMKRTSASAANLIIRNQSSAHVFLGKLTITSGETTVYSGTLAVYVLAGSTGVVPLRLTGALSGSRADLRFEVEDGSSQSAQATIAP
jgi:fimbrial chaperone protein